MGRETRAAIYILQGVVVGFADSVYRSSVPKGGKEGDAVLEGGGAAARGVVAVSISLPDGYGWQPTRAAYGRRYLVCRG